MIINNFSDIEGANKKHKQETILLPRGDANKACDKVK